MAVSMNNQEKLKKHLSFVRSRSVFYREFWHSAWRRGGARPELADLPVTDHDAFWKACSSCDNRLLTGPHKNGIVFKSGGTTGSPKHSFFSVDDWRWFCSVFGNGMRRGGLREGERVANLFYGGELYASFLFIGRCIEEAGVGVSYPLAGFAKPEEIIKTIRQFNIETLAGVPTTLINMLPRFMSAGSDSFNIKRCVYGGEAMYPDQTAALRKFFPGCEVRSIGVAGVDYGELGWVDDECDSGVHHVFDESTVVEILDEDLNVIEEPDTEGSLHVTNFRRRLMPVVRYPVGDRGIWIDPAGTTGRRFKLLGRTDKGARIGPVTLYTNDVRHVLDACASNMNILGFQLIVEHLDRRDCCTLRLAVSNPEKVPAALADNIASSLYAERRMFPQLIKEGIVHPLTVEWVNAENLLANPRTGKLMRVIDRRHES